MQEPEQHIHVDRERKLVDVRITGFITAEDAGWMGEDVRAAILSLGEGIGEHVTLYDVTGLSVAPNATIEAVKGMFANPAVRPLWARKVAMVTKSALGKLQLQRIREARDDIALFEDRGAALNWLLA
jgi:hypothetical protein